VRRSFYLLERGFSVLGSDWGSGEVLLGSLLVDGSEELSGSGADVVGSDEGSDELSGSGAEVVGSETLSGSAETSLAGSEVAEGSDVGSADAISLVGSGSVATSGSGSLVVVGGSPDGSAVVSLTSFLDNFAEPEYLQSEWEV